MNIRVVGFVVFGLILIAGAVGAQKGSESGIEGDTLGWHVVVKGDTLEGITEHYLGTPTLWQENWRLNPEVKNPHLLRIGRRLRVITRRILPERTAEVLTVSRRVEEKPHPDPWIPAVVGDLLKEKDGVRTYEESSTEIAFDDGTSLVLTENSMVFLREVRQRLTGVSREQLEIVEGQAELEARPKTADRSDIEILIGGVRTQPRPGSAGVSRSRLRRPENGGAQVMVYGGRAEVESGGAAVEVPAGMGTAVAEGKPPAPPERLLAAPVLRTPVSGDRLAWSNPVFEWERVEGAVDYSVEICVDRKCAGQILRVTNVKVAPWRASDLPAGDLYWRVTATAASGLDGYPATGRSLHIVGDGADTEPPFVVLLPEDGAAARVGGGIDARPGGLIRVVAHDDSAGVKGVRWRWNGGPWRQGPGNATVPEAVGEHVLEVESVDHAGRIMPTLRSDVVVASEGPEKAEVHGPHR